MYITWCRRQRVLPSLWVTTSGTRRHSVPGRAPGLALLSVDPSAGPPPLATASQRRRHASGGPGYAPTGCGGSRSDGCNGLDCPVLELLAAWRPAHELFTLGASAVIRWCRRPVVRLACMQACGVLPRNGRGSMWQRGRTCHTSDAAVAAFPLGTHADWRACICCAMHRPAWVLGVPCLRVREW